MGNGAEKDIIEAAASQHDVDLDRAVVVADPLEESDRIFIIECIEEQPVYRILAFGKDAAGKPASEEAIRIPESAVGAVQGLLHAAGLHVSNREFVTGPDGEQQISIRDLAEGMGLSKPLNTEDQ
jgi:hypothetical protein